MPIRHIEELKSRFQNADKPDGADFVDLIDTLLNVPTGSIQNDDIPDNEVEPVKLAPGSRLQALLTNAAGTAAEWADLTATLVLITQSSHGFSPGEVLTINGSGVFIRAQADDLATSQAVGIVKQVVDANDFILATGGTVDVPITTTPGAWHYLSAATPGVFTTTPPSLGGQYVVPLFFGRTANSGILLIQQAKSVITGTGTFDPVYIVSEQLATASAAAYVTLNIDALVPALAGTPFRFGIFLIDAIANNNRSPNLFFRKDVSSPEYKVHRIQSNDEDGIEAPDPAVSIFFFPVTAGPKSVQYKNTSSYQSLSIQLIGYIQ